MKQYYVAKDNSDPTKYVVIAGSRKPKYALADSPLDGGGKPEERFVKKVGASFVIDQVAKDTHAAMAQTAKDAMATRAANIKTLGVDLKNAIGVIDSMSSLAELKVILKKIVRYLAE